MTRQRHPLAKCAQSPHKTHYTNETNTRRENGKNNGTDKKE